MRRKYVIYKRVSTDEQGRSGLGLEAQERDIELFLTNFSDGPYEIIGQFQEVVSGRSDDRPQLDQALSMVRANSAELLVSKLDRLSRRVSVIAALMEDKRVKLRVASMPQADLFQLHIYAALAEQERTFISERTKAALKAAKSRGKKLGGMRDALMRRNQAVMAKADAEADRVNKIAGPLRDSGKTLAAIAAILNEIPVPTSRGGRWTPTQVARVLTRRGLERQPPGSRQGERHV